MPDYPENDKPENENPDIPASVIFTEMMRQAASQRRPDNFGALPSEADIAEINPAQDLSWETIGEQANGTAEDPPSREAQHEAAMEAQRIRRIKRRRERRRRRRVGTIGGFLRSAFIVLLAAGLVSTIFTYFTDPRSFGTDVVSGLQVAEATSQATLQPTNIPATPNWMKIIGIVSGHRGPENDPGAVCPDGLTEAEINFNVAQRVVRNLRARGYNAHLLDEFDPRLEDYQAAALVSIHANTCTDYNEFVSGYLVAKAAARPEGGPDVMLAECIAGHYEAATGLERRFTLTADMTNYHTFREIHALTPAAIIELGFMFNDREILTTQPDLLAEGITNGVLCFLEPEGGMALPPTPLPTTPEGQVQ